MRQLAKIWLTVAGCVTLLAGCITGHDVSTNEPVELRCRAVMGQSARADEPATADNGFATTFPTETDFTLWAFSLPRDKGWEVFHPAAEPFATRERFAYEASEQLWLPTTQSLPWDYPQSLTLIAYAPCEVPATYDTKRGLVVEDYDVEEWSDTDLLYTLPIADCHAEKCAGGVLVPFQHALAKVDIKARTLTTESSDDFRIISIAIENIATKGTFHTSPEPTWEVEAKGESAVLYDNAEGWSLIAHPDTYVEGAERLLLPQSSKVCIRVEVEDSRAGFITSREYRTPMINVNWQAGRHYTYTLEFTATDVKLEEPQTDVE